MIANLEGEKDGALGEVLDIGTGRGQLPILLLELGRATRASGMDWDDPKIKDAQTAAGDLNASFSQGDARTADYPASDTVLLIDLIHYFSIEEQDKMLDRAADATRAGGRVVVREADTERGLRSALTLMEERIFTLLRFNRGERVRFRSAKSIAERHEQRGLSCEIVPAWGKTPFANVLIIGRRAVH
jgi:SAM-dependent methyltransferase